MAILSAPVLAATTASVGSTAASAQTTPNAVLISVSGSSLSQVTAASTSFTPALSPTFSPGIYDYVLNCPSSASTVNFTLTAANGEITVNGQTGSSETVSANLTTDQAAVVQAPSPKAGQPDVQYWIRCLPTDFPKLAVVTDNGHAPAGYYLTQTAISGPGVGHYVMVLDNHGTPVWWKQTTPGGAGWFQMWRPTILAWDSNSNGAAPNFNNSAGYTTYSLKSGATHNVVPNNLPADGHEIVPLSDGNTLFLTDPEKTGVDLSSIGKGTNQNVADCVLQETNRQGNVVWQWDALQHIGVDESIDPISNTVAGQQVWDLFHCNSVSLDQNDTNPETADIVLSARENSSVYLIDRTTGNIVWKVGGVKPSANDPDAGTQYLSIINDPETSFYAEHDATLSADGELTLFDDHSGPPLYQQSNEVPGPARGVEYKIDTTAGTATLDWSYVAPDNESSLATGSFNRYANPNDGHTDNVIGWGLSQPTTSNGVTENKLFSEVNSDGTVTLAVDIVEQNGASFPNITGSYRVIKVSPTDLSLKLLRKNMGGLAHSNS